MPEITQKAIKDVAEREGITPQAVQKRLDRGWVYTECVEGAYWTVSSNNPNQQQGEN